MMGGSNESSDSGATAWNLSFPGSAWERTALPAPPVCLRGGASLPVGYEAEPRNQSDLQNLNDAKLFTAVE